jgi:hypothetical protein
MTSAPLRSPALRCAAVSRKPLILTRCAVALRCAMAFAKLLISRAPVALRLRCAAPPIPPYRAGALFEEGRRPLSRVKFASLKSQW